MTFFKNADEFIKEFDLGSKYADVVILKDSEAGFSVKRAYPDNIRYKPAKKKNNEPDDLATIWVSYRHSSRSKKEISSKL